MLWRPVVAYSDFRRMALAISLLALLAPGRASACLAEYRSPEWLVGNSSLIFIGEVEEVESGHVGDASRLRYDDGVGGGRSSQIPTVATVRILRILKGKYSEARIHIGSGPIRSCAPFAVYDSFARKDQRIFIVPKYAVNGEVALCWGGSLLPLGETTMIEARVARAVAYRQEYIGELQKKSPETLAAAQKLALELRYQSRNWPTKNAKEEEYEKVADALVKRLTGVDVAVIVATLAYENGSDEANVWWRLYVWELVSRRIEKDRPRDVISFQRKWMRQTLTVAGVETKFIDEYLAATSDQNSRGGIAFPPEPCGVHYRDRQKINRSLLTTHFILRYHHYDRGEMVRVFAGGFSAEILANLDIGRVKPLIASMYYSDGERLRWLAQQAIGYAPGAECVDLLLNDMVHEGHPYAWRALDHYQMPKETSARLAAMIDLCESQYSDWEQQAMWRSLQFGNCFYDVGVQKAISTLAKLEKPDAKPQGKAADRDEAERNRLAQTLREYLAAAKAAGNPAKTPDTTADEFRQWFRAHPAQQPQEQK